MGRSSARGVKLEKQKKEIGGAPGEKKKNGSVEIYSLSAEEKNRHALWTSLL